MSKSTAVAVFDISSSSVGGAHALVEHVDGKNSVTILVQERRDSGLEEEITIERFVEDTAKTLETVIQHVRTADVHHPSMIQVVLGSPWYNSYTRTITYNRATAFSCTQRLVDSLIEKEIAFLLKQPDGDNQKLGDTFALAEQQLSHVLLNGYETADPYGKKVQSLEIVLHVTLIPKVVAERFTSILRRSYGDRKIQVTTGSYAAFVALRDNGGIAKDCVIVDVGEEVTDVAFVKNSAVISQQSFPVGTYELYRTLSNVTGSLMEARTLVEAYRLKKLSPNNGRVIEKALQSFSATWQKGFHALVDQGNTSVRFPSDCYVVSDHRFENVFSQTISTDPFLLHSAAVSEIDVHFVDILNLSSSIKVISMEQPDTGLALGALFIERLI